MVNYKTNKQKIMDQWWQSTLGQAVFEQEKSILQSLKTYFHGQHQLQVGSEQKCLPKLSHHGQQTIMACSGNIQGKSSAFPIKKESIDTLLLSHELEFSNDPLQILREAERILVADGILILCSFNPWSLWGLKRLLSRQDIPPWQGHFYTQMQIKAWLTLLNFEIINIKKHCFRPPIKSKKWFHQLAPLEIWGKHLWPFFSGASILVTTKRASPLTAITKLKRTKSLFPARTLTNAPLSREKAHE